MIVLLTGQPGTGKTTIARKLVPTHWVVDGDEMRELLPNPGYTPEGRWINLNRAAAVASYLDHHGYTVVVSVVMPYAEIRGWLKDRGALEVYLHCDPPRKPDFQVPDYEIPTDPDLIIDTTEETIDDAVRHVYRTMADHARRPLVAMEPETRAGHPDPDSD